MAEENGNTDNQQGTGEEGAGTEVDDTGTNAGGEEGAGEKGGEADAGNDGKKSDEGETGEKSEGAPDQYEDFEVADGFEVDPERLGELQEFGREHNLTQEAAQALVNLHTDAFDKFSQGQQDAWDEMRDGWNKEVRADKTLQDDKGSIDAAVAVAGKAVKQLGGKDLQEALDLTGAGDHPAVVKAFHILGTKMLEDNIVFEGSGEETLDAAQKLYPTMRS